MSCGKLRISGHFCLFSASLPSQYRYLPAGSVSDGLCRIEPMLLPVCEALCQRNRQGDFHQGDETRWLVFAKVGTIPSFPHARYNTLTS